MAIVGEKGVTGLEPWLNKFLMQVRPQRRRATMKLIAKELRKTNQARARAQTNPDGSAWAPRSRQHWARDRLAYKGHTGRPLLNKLITNMGSDAGTNFARVGFRGGYQSYLAGVHQFGDTVDVQGTYPRTDVTFPIRALMGISEEDKSMIIHLVLGTVMDQYDDDK